MGLFSSKTKTTVGTVVERVIPDENIPNSVRTGVLKGVFDKNGGDVSDFIAEELITSIALNAERMYAYGGAHYTHGLPSGQTYTATQGQSQVEFVLGTIEGTPVAVDYYRYGPPNNLHIAWGKLVTEHGYSSGSNQLAGLTAIKGVPVYLEDMVLVIPPASITATNPVALEQWGPSAKSGNIPNLRSSNAVNSLAQYSPITTDVLATEIYAQVKYVWLAPGDTFMSSGSFNISVAGYDDEADYFQARYTVGTSAKYWMYRVGLGTYPSLDDLYDVPAIAGTYYPFAYFRYNKASEIADKTTQAYLTSKRLVKHLGMDYDAVAEGIDENPGIGDVEQAMVVMAVPANTSNELERRYLFEYFDAQYASLDNPYRSLTEAQIGARIQGNPDLAKTSTVIQDARFKMALSNGGIFKKRVSGNIGAIGTHDSGLTQIAVTTTAVSITEAGDFPYLVTTNVPLHYYRQQVSNTLYDEIQVYDLEMAYYIFDGYTTTGDEDDKILLIPLDRSITREYSLPDKEILYSRSLHYVFNSRVITKVKWYQTGLFKVIMLVVAIVITVSTYGAAWESIGAAIAAGTMSLSAFIALVLPSLIEYILITVAVRLFIKTVGVKIAFIAAVLAALAGVYYVIETGSLVGAPWAQELLKLSTGISAGVQDSLKDAFTNLLGEGNDWNKYVEEQTKLLDAAEDLLETNNFLSPFVLFGETPDDYYNRTVHSGNIGIVSIDAISSYVDRQLTLPKLNESFGLKEVKYDR